MSTLQRILLLTFAVLALATVTGCGDKGNAKRESGGNKGALSATTPRECPDVRGSFSAIDPEATSKSFTLWETMLGSGAPRQQGNPWRVMTIAGNADKALEITFSRPTKNATLSGDKSVPAYIRYALENPANTPLDKHNVNITRGAHYECKNGWLASLHSEPRTSVRRDAGGDLEAIRSIKRARVFSVWAETGAGIPYWFDTETQTARWSAASDSPSSFASPPARQRSRLAQAEYDQENGTSGGAARNDSFNVDKELRAMIDRDAIIETIRFEGRGRYTLVLRVESRGQVTRTMENLRANANIKEVEDLGVVSSPKQRDVAMISVQLARG